MRRVTWARQARTDLIAIQLYVEAFNRSAALRLARRLIDQAERLRDAPRRGRPITDGLRELTAVRPYAIRYRVTDEAIEIVTIRHSARQSDD